MSGRGHGVRAVHLNGVLLAGSPVVNPHRDAGLAFEIARDLEPPLRAEAKNFEIHLG